MIKQLHKNYFTKKNMKPVIPIKIISLNNTSKDINAVFDTGSFYNILRSDMLPAETMVIPYNQSFRTANKKSSLSITGITNLIIQINDKMIRAEVLISSDLGSEMLLGAGTMQTWDISILNTNGKTKIKVEHDMRDPEITEVD